ncbi:TetR/AcrR family transcriptional regulator [Solimonas variicoloris]|uniref:TetR/AcrR family transcriptional regulator n=1 Tax=Solimonas variicoloris TaxID=254408 RepID=UPI00035D362D|nr:TetR/AcrR family transcriptional regulator [Solimonas variicoloris]
MRYSATQKEETRRRIVETAAAAFRAHGLDGIGVADLMKRAGLTHGGFYAHFESKDALFAEAIAAASTQTQASLRKAIEQAEPGQRREAFIGQYLSPQHRERIDRGCSIAALGADVARQGARTRRSFEAQIEALIELAASVSDAPDEDRRADAIRTVATMVGAMLMARAVRTSALSDEILAAARQA